MNLDWWQVAGGAGSALVGAVAIWGPGYAAKRRIRRSAHTREPVWLVARGLVELGLKPHQVQAVMRQYRAGQ